MTDLSAYTGGSREPERAEFMLELAEARFRLAALGAGTDPLGDPAMLAAALAELSTAAEELRVAEEELRQQAEELSIANVALEQESRRYQDLFDFAPDAYLVTDPLGVVREANRAAGMLLRVRQDHIVGKPLVSYVALTDRARFRLALTTLREPGEHIWEVCLQPRGGDSVDAEMTVAPILDGDGSCTGLRWLVRDLSPHKRAAEERARILARQRLLESALERERTVTATLSRTLLGEPPALAGLQVGRVYEPASREDRVGGDFYDFIPLGERRVGIVIGDVCGHGLPAALYIATVKNMLRAYAFEDASPAAVLSRLNASLCRELRHDVTFVTLFFGVLDLETRALVFANGGHPLPVVLDPASGATRRLDVTGGMVGALPGMRFHEQSTALPRGAVLALFTDGVIEVGGNVDPYSDGGVGGILGQNSLDEAETLAGRIFDHVLFQSGGSLRDDVAIVVMRLDD